MKTKKWLWGILITLLTIVVLAGAGFAGYRLGLTQNPAVIKQLVELRAQKFNQMQDQTGKALNPQQNPYNGAYNPHIRGFDQRGNYAQGFDQRSQFNRRDNRGRDGFASPLFGLVHLIILGALLWLVYKFVKNSGWKLVREVQPAPVVSEAASTEEKKK